jgi:hypothetical protein
MTRSLSFLVLAGALGAAGCAEPVSVGTRNDAGRLDAHRLAPGEYDECGNGLDDDGDGAIDEDCPCASGESQPCWDGARASRGVGACADGVQQCSATGSDEFGRWLSCTMSRGPGSESCEGGGDEDCDGAIDEGCPCAEGASRDCTDEFLRAPCTAGTQACRGGSWTACEGAVGPMAELCGNGVDDDCDGEADDPSFCMCVLPPRPEECGNDVDDDCDGERDEGCLTGDDAGVGDAGMCVGAPVALLFPWHGFTTGSVHVPETASVVDHPLRPKLMWLPAADATEYEVQLEDSCETGSFRTCAFPSPEVSARTGATTFRPAASLPVSRVAPVGRRYYWRVRACRGATCGCWSEVRYLDVGRHADDFNGDGYADLAVGAYRQSNPETNEGNAFLYFGSPTGPRAEPDLTLDNPADQLNGQFGVSVASAGDVNGDGYADLVVGARHQSNPETEEGNAFVYFGSPTGPDPEPDLTLDNPADQAGGDYGRSVASAGDVDGDGYADLVVGAEGQDSPEDGEGSAFVYLGSPTGPRPEPDLTLDNPADQAGGRFGRSVASAGDLNGDGYPDLVVGAHLQSNPERSEGNAFVYFGSPTGPRLEPDLTFDNPMLGDLGRAFGNSVAGAGDLNADGYADLVVGAPYQSNPEECEGNAFVYFGASTGPRPEPDLTLDNPADGSVSWCGLFGYSVASAGDVNADGYADLVVAAPNQSNPEEKEGNAFLYLGSPAGPRAEPDLTLDSPADQARAFFGYSVASGDLDGDGYTDLIVGQTDKGSRGSAAGDAVHLYFGSPTGPRPEPDLTIGSPSSAGNGFGNSVACLDTDRGNVAMQPADLRDLG